MTVSADDFKNAMQLWASGVTVVTTQSEKFGVQGMTVTAFSSVSAEPPQILVCINAAADTGDGIDASQCFAVNILSSAQQETSSQFSGGCSQEERFAQTAWNCAATGAPILDESLMSLDCQVVNIVQAGTHRIIVGEVKQTICRSGEPLLYYRGTYRSLAQT
jgi:flavin reductase (DIM6/NTAB) family NADH-FMN oxidoreductase RutF